MRAIFVTGMQRSGTTWIARALAAATRSRLVHEPFNWRLHGDDGKRFRYYMRYLPRGQADPEFTAILREAVNGARQPQLPWLRDSVVVKDVHASLAVEAVHDELRPLTAIVVRHPCATALSWAHLEYGIGNGFSALLGQEELQRDHLAPFVTHMRKRDDYFFQLGAWWGAVYYTLARLAQGHPDWLWISHEAVCREPVAEFKSLLGSAGLRMAPRGRRFLAAHDHGQNEERPYSVDRAAATEPDKWRGRLDADAAKRVIDGASPFGVLERFYPDG